jgi:hypothetical protein
VARLIAIASIRFRFVIFDLPSWFAYAGRSRNAAS